jgi:hypothetical protein
MILEGESGAGKSSLLNAALLPLARNEWSVLEFNLDQIPVNTLGSVKARIETTPPSSLGLHTLVVLDQFEQLFVRARHEERSAFMNTVMRAVSEARIRLLVCIRYDFLDLLLRLCRDTDPSHVPAKEVQC